ncbi:hypothetical protein O181_026829 [Austropuccinia psidii MF-1]|uniref:Uncharacterized protein n=1 Tax=Austropuccinia psidii MF-1 TaxID=1389203 RepID=A0A9Q3CMZ8_9BASI|nr:hypothetical protein [Austropuccinia psidii MF-1]
MATRGCSQYSIQSDGGGLRSENDPTKGKRKGEIPSGTGSTQGSAIFQRKVPEISINSEPEFKLSMRNSKRNKSQSECSIDIYMSHEKQYYMVYKDKDWEMLPRIHQGVINSWGILKKSPQRGGNSEILQWKESTMIQISN